MADAGPFHQLWGDPRVVWWGHAATPEASKRKLEEILARCAGMPEGLGWWAVEARGTGRVGGGVVSRVVGNVVLQPAPYDHTAEVGYHLAHAAWGNGYATEAACAILRHGFVSLGLPEVSAVVQVDNQSSHRVALRAGLRVTGPIAYNGMPHLRYHLSREDALALPWAAPAET